VARHALLTYAQNHWQSWQFHFLARIVRLESWARRFWEKRQGYKVAAKVYSEMGRMAGDLCAGRKAAALRRVHKSAKGRDPRDIPAFPRNRPVRYLCSSP
jgi:hypothetical protein